MTTWVDTHCHLFLADEPAEDVLERAAHHGVAWAVCPGVDLATSLEARRLAVAMSDRVLWTAGLHPHDATSWTTVSGRLSTLMAEADAIGECGLDYYRELSPRSVQRDVFRIHLDMAAASAKPVVIHCRDAFSDVFVALESAQLGERAVLHCWTGGPRWTRRFADLGVTFSFAGPVTYATGNTLRLGAATAPPERCLVETDMPYLTPEPHRGQPNEPAYLPLIGAALAEVWGVDIADVARLTTAAATRVFGSPQTGTR